MSRHAVHLGDVRGPTLIMGVLNVTPDSFSDGGRYVSLSAAIDHAAAMAGEGADIIDVGGESTRPGAQAVTEAEELQRVIPVIEALAKQLDVPISVDTSRPAVMRAAVAAGAGMINDVRALRLPGAVDAAAELAVPVCLMHMQGEPGTMQSAPAYRDVVAEVREFLSDRVEACERAGIPRKLLVVDPGFGFGKSLSHNLQLLRHLSQLAPPEVPLLVGLSRKSLVGRLTGRAVDERLHGSVALAVYAALHGARIVRAHDIGATAEAIRVVEAVTKGFEDG